MIHLIYYTMMNNELEMLGIRDIGKLMSSFVENAKHSLVIDIFLRTKSNTVRISLGQKFEIEELKFKDRSDFYSLKTLTKFLSEFNKHKNSTKIFVLGGHNSGWFMYDKSWSNYTQKDMLYFDVVCSAIRANKLTLDVMVIDSCFGALIENLIELGDSVNYFVASPEYISWEGITGDDFCQKISDIKKKSDIPIIFEELAIEQTERSFFRKEPVAVTIVRCREFAKIIKFLETLQFTKEDFTKESVIDPTESMSEDSGSTDPDEYEVFYDLYNVIKDKVSKEEFKKFEKIFKKAVRFHKNKLFAIDYSNGVNISIGFAGPKELGEKLLIKTFKRLKAYKDFVQISH